MYRDVENIEPLTKDEMIEFYNHYLLPSSPSRAKASVHLIAQSSAEDVAADVATDKDPKEQLSELAAMLAQLLEQLGVAIDQTILITRLEEVDVVGGDTEGIMGAVGGYLKVDAGMPAEQVEQVMTQGKMVLSQVLPKLGIKPKQPQQESEVVVNGDAEIKQAEVVVIEDVKAFKASMPVSAGARPVKDLSEFEELEPKL